MIPNVSVDERQLGGLSAGALIFSSDLLLTSSPSKVCLCSASSQTGPVRPSQPPGVVGKHVVHRRPAVSCCCSTKLLRRRDASQEIPWNPGGVEGRSQPFCCCCIRTNFIPQSLKSALLMSQREWVLLLAERPQTLLCPPPPP